MAQKCINADQYWSAFQHWGPLNIDVSYATDTSRLTTVKSGQSLVAVLYILITGSVSSLPQLRGIIQFQYFSLHTGHDACRYRNTEQIAEEFPFVVTTTKHQDITVTMALELTRAAHGSMACPCWYHWFNLHWWPCQTVYNQQHAIIHQTLTSCCYCC